MQVGRFVAPALLLCLALGCGPAVPERAGQSRSSSSSTRERSAPLGSADSDAQSSPVASAPAPLAPNVEPQSPAVVERNLAASSPAVDAPRTEPLTQTQRDQSARAEVQRTRDQRVQDWQDQDKLFQTIRPKGEPTIDDVGTAPWLPTSSLPYEYWESQYLNAAPIGVTHYRVEKADKQRLKLTAKTGLQIQRAGQTIRQTVSVQTLEQEGGAVDSYFEESGGGSGSKTEGSITDGHLVLKTIAGGATAMADVPWPKGTWGPMGVYQLLLRHPMRSGETRQTHVFLPQIHKVALVTLAAGTEEDTTSPQGLLPHLLPVDVLMQLEDQGISSRMWVNAQGEVQKSVMTAGPNISSYRVSRDIAEQLDSQALVDVFAETSIKIEPPLKDPERAQRIDYIINAKSKDPAGLLSQQSNQSVTSETASRALLTVWRPVIEGALPAGPNRKGPDQTPPTADCSASTLMIKSDDAAVEKLAVVLAGGEKQPAPLALKLTEGVFKSIRTKDFSHAFDSAQDVARSLEGDCTEHAVLLTALLRNRGIPARIASGVVATDSDAATVFAYHMWTEAWLGDRWLPLDATLGTVAGCGHIKFLDTPLSESNPYAALLPVLTSLGQLKITVKEVIR